MILFFVCVWAVMAEYPLVAAALLIHWAMQ